MSQYDPKFVVFITSFLHLNKGFWLLWGSSKVIFVKISQHFIKSHIKMCLISQISIHSLWHVWFHGPVILSYRCISKTIWCMSVIFSDNETVWPKLWPQSKYKSTWHIFHGLVILLNLFKISWWMNIIVGTMDMYIFWSSDFASYLEDYLME